MIDPRKQRASDVEDYEDSHFAVALAACNPVLLATCSLSRRRHPLDPTPSFEESVKDLTNDANRADSESGKTYAEEYVVHGECILVCANYLCKHELSLQDGGLARFRWLIRLARRSGGTGTSR